MRDSGKAKMLNGFVAQAFDPAQEGAGGVLLRAIPLHIQLRHDGAPEGSLPGLVGHLGRAFQHEVLPRNPGGKPVGTVSHVLLEESGDLAGKVETRYRVSLPKITV